jgi:hypothetical protein
MGTLKCYEWIETESGTQISAVEGLVYNGVILGVPLEIDGDPNTAEFDDSMFPNGRVENVDGIAVVTPDEEVA